MKRHVEVAVRVRPPNEREKYAESCVHHDENSITITDEHGEPSAFAFDKVFGMDEAQKDLYQESVAEVVDSVLCGSHAIVFAYGQTGSGKTHTMLGEVNGPVVTEQTGVFFRLLADLVAYKTSRQNELKTDIILSAIEVYNDEPRDLLGKRAVMKIREAGDACMCAGLTTRSVHSLQDALEVYRTAEGQRASCSTSMNARSSRSHAMFVIDVSQIPLSGDSPKMSRVCIVDLAGSERIKRSGVQGAALDEAKHINKSLSTMGKVIHDLNAGSTHISYRDSKLTRLLRSCFADPTSRILLVANVSPAASSRFETVSTLRFANCVKNIKASTLSVDMQAIKLLKASMRVADELNADLRVAVAAYDYVHQGKGGSVEKYNKFLENRQAAHKEDIIRQVHALRDSLTKQAVADIEATLQRVRDDTVKASKELESITIDIEARCKKYQGKVDRVVKQTEEKRKEGGEESAKKAALQEGFKKTNDELDEVKGEIAKVLKDEAHRVEEEARENRAWGKEGEWHEAQMKIHERAMTRLREKGEVLKSATRSVEVGASIKDLEKELSQCVFTPSVIEDPALWQLPLCVPSRSDDPLETVSMEGSLYTAESEEDTGEWITSQNEEEYLDGPAEMLESMLADIEKELAELDPTRQSGELDGLFDSSEDDDNITEDEEDSEEDRNDPPMAQNKYESMKRLPPRHTPSTPS